MYMSLATRCTACGTVFRVVQDQLKVSEGWVRCGRCDEVFNAIEGLFDLEREPPPTGPLPAASTAQKPGGGPTATSHDEAEWPLTSPAGEWGQASLPERTDADLLATRPGDFGPGPARAAPPSAGATYAGPPHTPTRRDQSLDQSRDEAHDRWNADLLIDAAPETQIAQHHLDQFDDDIDDDATRIMPQADAPEFVRDAERQARWRRPRVRALLGLAVLFLATALALQAVHHFRDTVAARWPQVRPVLLAWCDTIGCTLEAPRRIEDIAVESTTLARAGPTSEAFALQVTLRNRGAVGLSVPSVDLKLTDGSGALIARRMLSPRDFGSTLAALPPGSDTSLQMLLTTGGQAITGYTVEVFYP
ncbi:MAG: hypothetical protein AD742_19370 [Methylibium sp. NZG]|nr:MAG: hypothetical protein AD742_19370 [Methylibium sp. NZG]